MASLVDKALKETRGSQPAADSLTKKVKEFVEGSKDKNRKGPMENYIRRFLQNRTAGETVDYLRSIAHQKRSGIESIGGISNQPFFVTDKDMGLSGAVETACAYVSPGDENSTVRIVITHIDSPCLQLRPQPVYFDGDATTQFLTPSFTLLTDPYGSLNPADWAGTDVSIIGHKYSGGRQGNKREVPGVIHQRSHHIDSGEERKFQDLRVDTGIRNLKELYDVFGVKDGMDFARSQYFVVPKFNGSNLSVVGNDYVAYGQDDRSPSWAATHAFLNANKSRANNTMMVFYLDREEVGGTGSSAGYNGFVETVIKEVLYNVYGEEIYKDLDLPLDLAKGLMGGWPAIAVDLDVGLGGIELDAVSSGEHLDMYNGSKRGWGFFINSQPQQEGELHPSPKHIGMLMDIMDKGLGRTNARSRYQMTGNISSPDSDVLSGTQADIFYNNFPCVFMGAAATGLHSPRGEVVNRYDLYWLSRGLELYLTSDPKF